METKSKSKPKYKIVTPENVGPEIFPRLKEIVGSFLPHDRYVALAFDHCRLSDIAPHLFVGKNRAKKVRHKYMVALTFRVLTRMAYQTFACLFWNGDEVKTLASTIHVYIQALTDAGLHVVATICPDDPSFVRTVMHLTQIPDILVHRGPLIYSSGKTKDIVHLYDPSQLLKSFRNFLMQHKCYFEIIGNEYQTSWEDFENWYMENINDPTIREKYKRYIHLTRETIWRTDYAVKLFSRTFSNRLFDDFYDDCTYDSGLLGAAELCAFMNNVFDSFNANTSEDEPALRRAVTKGSVHALCWENAAAVFESMYFFMPVDPKFCLPDEFNGDSEEEREAKQDADQENLAEDFKEMNLVDGKVERKDPSDTNNNAAKAKRNIAQKSRRKKSAKNKKTQAATTKKFVKLPCVQFWLFNVLGIKAIVEKLRARRFLYINTKSFSCDNLESFFKRLKVRNGIRPIEPILECNFFELVDQKIADICVLPSASHTLAPDEE